MGDIVMLTHAIMHDRRNMLRIHRRQLRDTTDPFHIPEARFTELFRFNKESAIDLLTEISQYMKSGVRNTFIPKSIMLTAALHYYATGSFLRDIGQDFVCAISKTMICRIVHEITYIIQDKLMPKYVCFPRTAEEQNIIQQRFFNCCEFPGVIGVIDCTHVKIKKPTMNVEHCYRNRKGYFSKNVQIICNYDLQILACYARFGGGTHDSFIWENSRIRAFLENQYRHDNNTAWLIGDSGYPLQPWIMTPFRNTESNHQENFNIHHIQTRNCIERLNGVLKKLFACLSHDRGLLVNPALAGAIINACCTLHNLRQKYNLPIPEPDNFNDAHDNNNLEIYDSEVLQNNNILNEGKRVRETIVRNYFSS